MCERQLYAGGKSGLRYTQRPDELLQGKGFADDGSFQRRRGVLFSNIG